MTNPDPANEKFKKAHETEVRMIDLITENRELESKVFKLENQLKAKEEMVMPLTAAEITAIRRLLREGAWDGRIG